MKRLWLAGVLALPGAAWALPDDPVRADLTAILIAQDCRMQENDLAIAMRNAGHSVSDYQARVIALYRAGYLTAPTPGELQMINKKDCA